MQRSWLSRCRAASALLPLAVVACVAACSSSSTAPGAKPTVSLGGKTTTRSAAAPAGNANSCTVITQAEAGAALGQPVRAPVRGHATVEGGVACVYYGPAIPVGANPDIPFADSVRVVLVTGPKALKYFNDYRSKVSAEPISGLGDRAYYDGYASISVLKGDEYVRIAVGIANPLAAEKALAADALRRM